MADLNVAGLVSIIVFYLLILAIGIFAGWRKNRHSKANAKTTQEETNEVILAGRTIGYFIGCFTMTGEYCKELRMILSLRTSLMKSLIHF